MSAIAAAGTPAHEVSVQQEAGWRQTLRREAGLAAELAALTGLVFARPVLGSFGASPETLIARGADRFEVIAFGLAVVLLPWGLAAALGAFSGVLGPRLRLTVHGVLMAVLSAVGSLQVLGAHTPLPDLAALVVAVAVGVGVAVWRWRAEVARTFLRYAGLASVAFLVHFLVFSPASSLAWGARSGGPDAAVTAGVADALGDSPPPVVVVVLDALSTATLLDAEGRIHADVYPNLATLAADGTWYRNHTTVSPQTVQALPAILTGVMPERDSTPPVASAHERNLFTLLGGVYDVNAVEQVTALCPRSLCPDTGEGELLALLGDAQRLWRDSFESGNEVAAGLPGAFGDRYAGFAEWVETQPFAAGEPRLHFYHVLLPHEPWNWLPGGERYRMSYPPFGSFVGRWGAVGAEVGAQRHILQMQAVDELLGRLFDRLRDAGMYDDALIVVTADHGEAFVPEEPIRPMSEGQFDRIMWTPLIVKEPGMASGTGDAGSDDAGDDDAGNDGPAESSAAEDNVVDDSVVDDSVIDDNVLSVDVLPMIAEQLGIDLAEIGWEVDGLVPDEAAARDPGDKMIMDWDINDMRAHDGKDVITVDGREGFRRVLASDMIEGTGALAVWQRTPYGDLLGAAVDELNQGEPAEVELEVQNLDWFDDVDQAVPPLEFLGFGWLEAGDTVAVTVNGTVAALAPVRETQFGVSAAHALLHPGPLESGRNDIAAYHVEGDPDDPVLRRLEVVHRDA
jgi:hypothetical protein